MKTDVGTIIISDKIYIKKEEVYDIASLESLYTYPGPDEILTTILESDTHFIVPSNSYHKLNYKKVVDKRNYEESKEQFSFSGKLRWEQQEVVDKFFSRGRARTGIIQAPCGWGKTYTGCNILLVTT